MATWTLIAGLLAGLAGVFAVPPRYAHAAIGTPTSIGTASSSSASTSLQITTTASVTAGNSIIVVFAMDPAAGTVSITDSASNTYTKDADITQGSGTSGVRVVVWSVHNVALSSGGTITVTLPSATSKAMQAIQVSGLHSSGLDQSGTGTGTTSTPSATSAVTTRATELVIGAIAEESTSTITAGSGYSTVLAQTNSGSLNPDTKNVAVRAEYKTVSATGAQTADATLGSSNSWAAAVVTYEDGAAVPDLPTPLAALLASLGAGSVYYVLRRRAVPIRA